MISIKNGTELGLLIQGLSRDIVNAHVHWRLFQDLNNALAAQPLVWAQSRTFWELTVSAHQAIAIENLCRAFDQDQQALHLLSWLRTIKDNLHLFQQPAFKSRLAENPFVDSLAAQPRVPDAITLDADIQSCTCHDPLVQKLWIYRGQALAHTNAGKVIGAKPVPTDLALMHEDIEKLLSRALELLNTYSHLFAAEVYSVGMVGHSDYKYIFKTITADVERSLTERSAFAAAHLGDSTVT